MKFKELPEEVIVLIKEECRIQSSYYNEEATISAGKGSGGFTWDRSTDDDFWSKVLSSGEFNKEEFYKKYPKKLIPKIEETFILENKIIYIMSINDKKYKITIENEE